MQEDLSKLSKTELVDKMIELGKQDTVAFNVYANAKTEPERIAARASYDALVDEIKRIQAEYDKRRESN